MENTEIFNNLEKNKDEVLTSLRQPIQIIVDTKADVEEYDWVSLAAWTMKQHFEDENDPINNNVLITGHVACKFQKIPTKFECNIEHFNTIYPCPKCTKFVNIYPMKLKNLSFHSIEFWERAQKFVDFPARIIFHGNSLEKHVAGYLGEGSEFNTFPLNRLRRLEQTFSDKLQKLGFGFASLFLSFVGNISRHFTGKYQKKPDMEYFEKNSTKDSFD